MGKGTFNETAPLIPHSSKSAVRTCLFDLDDTLYPLSTGIAAACRKNTIDALVKRLGFSEDCVEAENMRLYRRFGTTMAGLRAEGHEFSFDEWHNLVHVPLPYDMIRPDPDLRKTLHSISQRKFVFTNADRGHAARCLSRLGLEDCLHGVITFEDVQEAPPVRRFEDRHKSLLEAETEGIISSGANVVKSWYTPAGPHVCCKPQVEAFHRALILANADPHHSMMFDDSAANITEAKKAGLRTCLVGSANHSTAADYCVESLHHIHAAVPELWEDMEPEEPTESFGCQLSHAMPAEETVTV